MRIPGALLLLAAFACSDASPPTAATRIPRPFPQPAKVEVVDAKVRNATENAVVVDGQTWVGRELVTFELVNDGGPGWFIAEFWGPGPNDTPVLWHASFPTSMGGKFAERVTWPVEVPDRIIGSPPRVQWIVIRTRQPNFTWAETSRFEITDWPQ